MYLKSIEVQGFKSFVNRIVFEFPTGITGIVGPNGSGKSNVADAVRWVLGEQSAKQLRGAKMEDVIFAGTQARKPVGYAYVSITLDNSDHALLVDYNEVTVTRKVFRSGESEYKINGNSCRLRDITELFYDTGIGKEGYSIIGQGQIDKILSGKPEERRELFDEAAGIVKFKRRKAESIKKLEHEHENLVRVKDILAELEKQVEPLKEQSERAREYLKLKEHLKIHDVNAFLLEHEKIKTELSNLNAKLDIVMADLKQSNEEYEAIKAEYEDIEEQLKCLNDDLDNTNHMLSDTEVEKERLEGMINVYAEQIKTIEASNIHFTNRQQVIDHSIEEKQQEMECQKKEKEGLDSRLKEYEQKKNDIEQQSKLMQDSITEISEKIDWNNNIIFGLLGEKNSIAANNQRLATMLEQLNIRKAEYNGQIIQYKSEEHIQDDILCQYEKQFLEEQNKIKEIETNTNQWSADIEKNRQRIGELTNLIDRQQAGYHREKSKLESLIDITTKYDGYGNSIKKIMEQKASNKGILGVIADVIKVEKKYEIAIETALGGTIQNIVTDNENTAKELIAYLKENKFGRATFLPLSTISGRNTLEKEPCIKENGVVGIASNLVKVSFEYEKLAKYLLGRILVVDTIDNALVIARKYKHSIRMVTLEGEQLNPGGSMTGGAFKNTNNLLGRRREIEELKKNVAMINKELGEYKEELSKQRQERTLLREQLDNSNQLMREAQIAMNTVQMNLNQVKSKKEDIIKTYKLAVQNIAEIDSEIEDINLQLSNVTKNSNELDYKKESTQKEIDALNALLLQRHQEENKHNLLVQQITVEYSSLVQKDDFIHENMQRLDSEIQTLENEKADIIAKMATTNDDITAKNKEISDVKEQIESTQKQINHCHKRIDELKTMREQWNETHKAFFEKREQISTHMSDLDKEATRLNASIEKQEEANDNIINYMWEEYELTYRYALPFKDENLTNLSFIKKQIQALKTQIKSLGDVNVNAIEEYKQVSERYAFLKEQHDDLIESENVLNTIIKDLDTGMRVQFKQKFEEIKVEFDNVFKELFGGGRGTLQLMEDEDILEAGINIISQPPGKKLQNMMQLSGGERALTAIALLFAIQNLKPSPFCLLDEIEAALDDSNVERFANYLHKLTKHTQFIVITHRRGTMNSADRLYGITMQEKGISTLVSVDLIEDKLEKERGYNGAV